jgi:hypothetical protein
MFGKLLSAAGIAPQASAARVSGHAPYKDPGTNQIYNLLFCDDAAAFAPRNGESPTDWQSVLFASRVDIGALAALAADPSQEGRIRYLATQKLRNAGQRVPLKQLFGVIVEMPLEGGLDTLAAYSDGSVRYINQTGRMTLAEPSAGLDEQVGNLLSVARPVVKAIGPWGKPRLPPPAQGDIRLSFLVSDGLCFGQGPLQVMQREPMAAVVVERATELLRAVAAKSVR